MVVDEVLFVDKKDITCIYAQSSQQNYKILIASKVKR